MSVTGGGPRGRRQAEAGMPALVLRAFGTLAVDDVPVPPLAPGEVRVAPRAVGICASDVHGYLGASGRRAPGMVMGHEAAGKVVEVADDVSGVEVGAVVAVNPVVSCGRCDRCLAGLDNLCLARRLYGCVPELPGAFAASMAVRAENVVPVEASTPAEWLALCEPLAVGAHAARLAQPRGRRIGVIGGGMIGLATALAAQRLGAETVLVLEPDGERRKTAARLGVPAIPPPEEDTPEPLDAVVEAVGGAGPLALALRATPSRGTVVLVGLADASVPLPAADLVMEERRLVGSAVYTRSEFREVVASVVSGDLDLEPVVGARLELEALPGAFADLAAGRARTLRTLFVPGAGARG